VRIGIVTIFPDFVKVIREYGVIAQAVENGLLHIDIFNLRDFTTDKHKVVDDYPYGGGPGMVMKPEPFFRFLSSFKATMGKLMLFSLLLKVEDSTTKLLWNSPTKNRL